MSRDREPQAAIPHVFLYDEGGGQTFTAANEPHTWDSIEYKTSHFFYVADDDRILFNKNSYGLFEITFECSFNTSYGGTVLVTSQIYKNGDAVTGAKAQVTVGGGQYPQYQCKSIHCYIHLKEGDYIQVKTQVNTQSADSIGETSRIIIKFIPTHGWDNSSGGRMEYSGGVMR
jgi:hypothetical protein